MLRVLSTIVSVLTVQAALAYAAARAESTLAASGPAGPFRVPLVVAEDQGVARVAEPVSGGMPLPRGAVRDPAELGTSSPAAWTTAPT